MGRGSKAGALVEKGAQAVVKQMALPAASTRLVSLDALRGFTMFWIMGGEDVVSALARIVKNPLLTAISNNLTEHAQWEGFHFYDLIFPNFLFIIGVTLPFALGRREEKGGTRRDLIIKILQRAFLMFVLGWIYYGLLEFKGWEHQRIFGVLQRLALGYCAAALIFLNFRPRAQALIAGGLLIGYWLAMRWVHVPGFPLGTMSPEGNVANYIDRLTLQPGQMYQKYGDPEGLFSTIPAIATALLGLLAGQWLRTERPQKQKALGLVAAGAVSIAGGYLWSLWFPIIKKTWTSSYVLVAGGWSLLGLALFYWLVEVRGYKRWTTFFVVIGMNALTIYVAQRIIEFEHIADFFVGGILRFVPVWQPFLFALSVVAIRWLFLLCLYRQKIFLRL